MLKTIFGIFGVIILFSMFFFFTGIIGKGCDQGVKTTHIDDAVENYEEFQSIFNTCQQVNTDLCAKRQIPDTDKGFDLISKSQQVFALKAKLNRWCEEYDAKSKMWGRSLWKSSKLPFELHVSDFGCYDEPTIPNTPKTN